MSPQTTGFALLLLGALLLLAKLVRTRWRTARRLFLPSSIIGGTIALLLGPELLGRAAAALGAAPLSGGLFGADVYDVWRVLPELLISVVFAALFLGQPLPRLSAASRLAAPQITFGLAQCAGQYVIGLLLALCVLGPVFGLPAVSGVLLEVAFEGGPGTVARLGDTFANAGFAEGRELALALATTGMLAAIITGIALVNWGVRRGHTAELFIGGRRHVGEQIGREEGGAPARPAAPAAARRAGVEPLVMHAGLIAVAIMVGQGLLRLCQAVEQTLFPGGIEVFAYVPLFPLAMFGGVIVQVLVDRFAPPGFVDRALIGRVQGFTLEVIVITALGSLSLTVIAAHLAPFLILATAGIVWCVGSFVLLAPRMLPSHWFELGIGNLGQTLGVSAVGLMLIRLADPGLRSPALEAFGYKQLAVQPFFGGGIVTAVQIPLILHFGPWPFLLGAALVLALTLALGLLVFGRMRPLDDRAGAAGAVRA
jgi:ESS family glutamate:Na+ symporter